jgi:hypothetical protein
MGIAPPSEFPDDFGKRRMMGGSGSGRPSGSGRDTVESSRSIDVNQLNREGRLRAGWIGGWQWTRGGEKVASINLRAERDHLHLTYRARIGGGDWEDVSETVRIVRIACRFGGERAYFICPGVVNGSGEWPSCIAGTYRGTPRRGAGQAFWLAQPGTP